MKNYYLYGFCRNLNLSELEMLRLDIKKQIGEYHYGKPIDNKLPKLLHDLKIVRREEKVRKLDYSS